jgi:hypothetical protein
MEENLHQIFGIGDAITSELVEQFPSQKSLNSVSVSELNELSHVTPDLAICIRACVCRDIEAIEAVDKDVPRLSEKFEIDTDEVERIKGSLIERSIGRESDAEKLIQHSLAAHYLPVEDYRSAFDNHCRQIDKEIPEYAENYPLSPSEEGLEYLSEEEVKKKNERHKRSQLRKRRDRKMNSVNKFIEVFLHSEGPFATKADAIIAINVVFNTVTPERLRGYHIANPVGCTKGYANEFEPIQVGDKTIVLRKEYAARRQLEKAEQWQRQKVLDRDCEECVRCGEVDDLVVHHIKPVIDGGSDKIDNMVTLCSECHHEAHGGFSTESDVVYDPGSFWQWVESSSPYLS